MKRIKIIKSRVAALIMSFFLTLGLIAPAFNISAYAEAVEVVNGSCTIADIIFSYCASGGVAITNNTVIDEVYNVYGNTFGTLQTFVQDGLLTYSDGTFVDTGLSTYIESELSNVSTFDIGSLFSQSAEQNPSGVALSASSTLSGIAGSVSATGVLPIAVGTGVVAYSSFQLGTLIGNYITKYLPNIQVGAPINTDRNLAYMSSVGLGGASFCWLSSGRNLMYRSCESGMIIACVKSGLYLTYYTLNPTNHSLSYRNVNNSSYGVSSVSSGNYAKDSNFRMKYDKANPYDNIALTFENVYSSQSELLADFNNWKNGNNLPDSKTRTPDTIGSDGNIYAVNNDGNYTVPSLTPKINPESDSVNPTAFNQADWNNLADNASNNYINGNPDSNADLFQSVLDAIKINQPTPSPNPEPEPEPEPTPEPYPDPNPDPETVPVTVPSVNPYPDSYPVPDPESVPDNKPQPEYTEKQTENQTDIVEGDPFTTPDLLNKFPFCIPRDILRAFKKLDAGSREAPHIQWTFNPNSMIDYTFDIDFAVWNNIASLLRLLELIAFIIALGVATRNLILS